MPEKTREPKRWVINFGNFDTEPEVLGEGDEATETGEKEEE